MKSAEYLAKGVKGYVDTIAELMGLPVKFISIGPDLEQTILL